MARHRRALPQLGSAPFLTDGGLETTLIFHDGIALPHFAAFPLLTSSEGIAALRKYFAAYARLARRHGVGLVLESATWRASTDWGRRLGYNAQALALVNVRAIELLEEIRRSFEGPGSPIVTSGCIGPRRDGYVADQSMSAGEAERYHRPQIEAFAESAADMVSAITMTTPEEAIGIVRAARDAGMLVAISFTLEVDGRLPSGQPLTTAIERVDEATGGYASYFMINCAHPSHVAHLFGRDHPALARVRGLRANASRMSHAELNDAATLDTGDPHELGLEYAALKLRHPPLTILGGCCGTDDRHVASIAEACLPLFDAVAAGPR